MDSAAQISLKARKTAGRYLGSKAETYDADRKKQAKWAAEDEAVAAALSDLPRGATILDAPCGTGRFFPLYHKRGFDVIGLDISPAMLDQAKRRLPALSNEEDVLFTVREGDIFATGLDDDSVDVVVCMRFMNLIEASDVALAAKEFQRIARKRVIFGLRVRHNNPSGHYHSPHSIDVVEPLEGWTRSDVPMHQEDYRLVTLDALG